VAASARRAYVFHQDGAGWKQTAKLEGSDTAAGDHSDGLWGFRHDCDSGRIPSRQGAGRAYVFTETPGGWRQVVELKGKDTIGSTDSASRLEYRLRPLVVGATGHAGGAVGCTCSPSRRAAGSRWLS